MLAGLEPESDFHLGEYVGILRRRWRLVALATLVGLAVALVHFFVSPREYRATTTLQIERRNMLAVVTENLLQLDGGDSPSSAYFQTQYELLQSRGMAERVIQHLELHRDPVFAPERASLLADADAGGEDAAADGADLARLATRLLRHLEVQPVRNTYLVKLSYVAPDPQLAARVVNGLADVYIDWGIETRSTTAGKATSFLASQIASLKEEIRDKELQLATNSRTSDVVAVEPGTNPVLQRLQALNTDYSQAVSQRIEMEARYNEAMSTPAESVADTLSNGLVTQLRQKQIALEQEYATKLDTFKPDWPAMVELKSQIDKGRQHLRTVVGEMADQARRNARAEYQTALRREESLADELQSLKDKALPQNSATVELNNLQIEISTRRALLDELMRKQSETEVASRLEGTRESNVRVVDRAVVPRSAFRPTLRRDAGFGLGLGLLLGIGGVFLLEYMDRTLKTSDEVERVLGLPVLAVIPEVSSASGGYGYGYGYGMPARRKGGGKRPRKLVERKPASPSLEVELVPASQPRLPVSEAYRSLRTALLLSSAKQLQTVAVTSTQAGEGKSATATNLAIVMAQLGRRVLLVDADLRKPRLHRIFHLPNRTGLVTQLTTGGDPEDCFLATATDGLAVCPSGPIPPNPSELLSSERMSDLLTLARSRFDFVVVDTPPAMAVTDATLVGAQVDGVVLCLRSGCVLREDALACVDRLLMSEVKVLGVLLNAYRTSDRRYGRYAYPYAVYRGDEGSADSADSAA
jgi:capsular exopolysaccharide synthesis family protein